MTHCVKPDYKHSLLTERIEHAGNKGEYKIPESNYTIDGYDPIKNTLVRISRVFLAWLPSLFSKWNG